MRLVGFLWRYLRPYVGWLVLALSAVVVFAAANTMLVSLFEPVFSEVLQAGGEMGGAMAVLGNGTGAAPDPDEGKPSLRKLQLKRVLEDTYRSVKERLGIGPEQVVYFVPLLFCAVFLVRSVADFMSSYAFKHVGLGVTTDIRNQLYRNILHQPSRFYADHPTGELVSRVVSDVAIMESAVSNRLLDLVQQSVTLLFLVFLLLSTHFKLALVSLVVMPAVLYPIVRFGEGMRRSSHRSQERMADLANLVSEGVRGHRVVKAFGMEGFEYDRFHRATRRHLRVNRWAQMLASLSSPVVESLAVVGASALLIYAGLQIRLGKLDAALLLQFISNIVFMYDPIRKLNRVNLVLQQSRAAAQRILRILDVPHEDVTRPGSQRLETVAQGVTFRDLQFSYDDQPVLRGVNVELRRGEVVALVGPSGAGKTTLANLLPRFFDPDSGRVEIDGIDIRDLSLSNLRSLIGIVTQETVLFNDTVRNNIAYGRADLPLDRIREAAAAAYADEFISLLPQGYDTIIGESGLRLSGGQRQRLTIARALLKNPPILILDEATSQLDAESEALVQKALSNLMHGRTTLVIAHRLATVTSAHRIIVLEDGRVAEEGSHDELLARNGVYKRLYDLQFRV